MARTRGDVGGKLLKGELERLARKPGRHHDGGGLWFNVSKKLTVSWSFTWMVEGKQRERGLGSWPTVDADEARKKARALRDKLEEDRNYNPIMRGKPRRDGEAKTFGEAAELRIEAWKGTWRHPKNEQQWTNSLTSYCKENKHPIWDKDVALVEKGDVTAILRPIWDKKPVTARRVRHRIEKVLDFAKANGWRKGDNPAKWVGDLKELLPPLPGGGHQPACPVDQVPAFLAELRGRKSDGVRGTAEAALEFAILTNTRSTAAWKARWVPEIDFKYGAWTVPAARNLKQNKKEPVPHRVPLANAAMAILAKLDKTTGYIFPGRKQGRPTAYDAMEKVVQRINDDRTKRKLPRYVDPNELDEKGNPRDIVPHGFRSSFKTWAVKWASGVPHAVIEYAMAHAVGDEVEQAYLRGDLFGKRLRELMEAWAHFCQGKLRGKVGKVTWEPPEEELSNVVPIKAHARRRP